MVPLDPAAARHVRTRLGLPEGPGLLALRHALAYRRPGLWGDDPVAPRSVLLVREGDRRIEAFGIGEPWPALAWLLGHGRAFALQAPDEWLLSASQTLGGDLEQVEVETWSADSVATPSDVLDDLQFLTRGRVRKLRQSGRASPERGRPRGVQRGRAGLGVARLAILRLPDRTWRGVRRSACKRFRGNGLGVRPGRRLRCGGGRDHAALSPPRPRPRGGVDAGHAYSGTSRQGAALVVSGRPCGVSRPRDFAWVHFDRDRNGRLPPITLRGGS